MKPIKPIKIIILAAAVGCVALAGLVARGDTINWTNTSGGNWSVAANWSPNQVPDANDTVVITNDGDYTVTVDIAPTIAGFDLGATSGSTTQSLVITSLTLTINGNGIINSRGMATFDNSSLVGTNIFDGTVNWTGGFFSGQLTINGSLLLSGAAQKVFASGNVNNAGSVVWGGSGRLVLQTQMAFTNLAGGLFDVQSDAPLIPFSTETNAFYNFGTFRKSAGAGSTIIETYFYNSGIMDVQTGSVDFDLGKGFFHDGSSFTGAGATRLDNGEFTFDGTIASQNLQITSFNAQLMGTKTFAGTLVCSGGLFNDQTTIGTNCTLLLPTAAQKNF
jgi:hypothetical protein